MNTINIFIVHDKEKINVNRVTNISEVEVGIIDLEIESYSKNGVYDISLMYNERFMLLGALREHLLVNCAKLIHCWDLDVIKETETIGINNPVEKKLYFNAETLQPIKDEEMINLLNMIC